MHSEVMLLPGRRSVIVRDAFDVRVLVSERGPIERDVSLSVLGTTVCFSG